MIALLLAWLLTDIVATYGVWHFWRSFVPLTAAPTSPPVVILVAIKGVGSNTATFLDSILGQQYPDYRIVFTIESEADPALGLIEAAQRRRTTGIEVDLVFAGDATHNTQKVHNLRTALGRLRDSDRIVVFADADTLLPPDWLMNLVRPIALGEVDASTGYRWPLPTDRSLATLIAAAADLSITTSARSWRWNVCWGGSCAVARSALDAVDLASVWNCAASDDVTLTRALRAHGFRINSPLRALVPSPVAHSWTSLFEFARRQHMMMRTYAPRHWLLGGWVLCVPAIGAVAATLALFYGNGIGGCAVLASFVLMQSRIWIRRRIARMVLPSQSITAAQATLTFASIVWPLIHLVHAGAFLSSCVGRRFSWAGITYRLDRNFVSVIARQDNPMRAATEDLQQRG